jgi:hypothetical protein
MTKKVTTKTVKTTTKEEKAAPVVKVEKKGSSLGKKVYFVKKSEGRRQVILREGKKVIQYFSTKLEAEEFAKKLAENQDGTVLIHASKGKNKGRFQ